MNEIANIAERVGADVELVRQGSGSDPRIGHHFNYPGAGCGGSGSPKGVQALERTARRHGHDGRLLAAVAAAHHHQKAKAFELSSRHFDGRLAGKTIALWGLAFKPNTDDMREAPSRRLMEALWQVGAKVRAFDPEARAETARQYGERDDLVLC